MTRKMPFVGAVTLFVLIVVFSLWSQQALADPPGLPIVDNLDANALLWSSASWQHSEAYRSGTSGKGLGAIQSLGPSTLRWQRDIDLRFAVAPRLRFLTSLKSRYHNEAVFIYSGNTLFATVPVASSSTAWREVIIDLTPYNGLQIRLEWGRLIGSITDVWMIDNVVVEDMAFPTMTPPPTLIPATFTPLPTSIYPTFTPYPTQYNPTPTATP